ncbi:protein NIM1-INTERACTING 2 [Dioscorea cayenensis subsp. rotundata]|uniref:Protein NIM1-INTERACTING 2 n=1 Tax=Dioscorea cayennensis subsp. rotundata TaxID=55577 RepID=A0AB40CZG0_DIOCR|nr:protein NIM1-INTERACTING 2 [Dioscorea cayenensis subsp. rotundata]
MKRRREGEDGGEKKAGEGDRTVTDEEVEEFFTILRRISEAWPMIARRDGDASVNLGERWLPEFVMEDFEAGERDQGPGSRDEDQISRQLDLNQEPKSDSVPPKTQTETARRRGGLVEIVFSDEGEDTVVVAVASSGKAKKKSVRIGLRIVG